MDTLLTVLPYVLGATIFLSIFFKPDKKQKPTEGKPSKEEFEKSMKLLLVHGIITTEEYTRMLNSGRGFTNP